MRSSPSLRHLFIPAAFLLVASASLHAAPRDIGPKACQDCHKTEYDLWNSTRHAKSFKDVHRSPKIPAILAAAGGNKNMRKNVTCTQCHFTMEQEDASAPVSAKSGPSCESCHGSASEWVAIHNNYGGPGIKQETESAEHKAKRIADSKKAGMIRGDMHYDIAVNCMECHGFANPRIDPAVFGKMLDAGHPLNADYELVRYSQGSVRHRFYPPHLTVNAEMTPAELARLFITGAAAKLVSASSMLPKATSPSYKAAQQKRIESAAAALSAIKDVPEAGALLASPTEDNARALVAAIAGKDLSNSVKSLLPGKSQYK